MSIDAVKLAQDLIKCPSVTPADEGAQQVLKDALSPSGFVCHDVPFGNIQNVFARYGEGGKHLCFCGHTDVVPVGDEAAWTHPPFGAVIEDGILYGRGASDMKTNICCFVEAVTDFIAEHKGFDGSISLLITGDEEAEAINGTVKVLEWMEENGHTPDVALVGEPSNPNAHGDEIKIGRRGSLTGYLAVTGKQGHVAYHTIADNPIPRLVKLVNKLVTLELDDGTEHFQPSNLEFSTVDVGNTADNVIPAAGRATFNVRFNDTWSGATLEAHIRKALDEVGEPYELKVRVGGESFITAPGEWVSIVAAAVKDVTGREPLLSTAGGTSDARFVTNYAPVLEYGLINKTIHQVDENVVVDDIHTLTSIYKKVLESYFL